MLWCWRALLAWFAIAAASPASACGEKGDPCRVPLGEYYASVPAQKGNAARPALIYFHGGGGDGFAVVGDDWMVKPFHERNYVVIAPQGLPRPPLGNGWIFREDHPKKRDELEFARQVAADAVKRFNIDRARVMLGGHSIGGSLVWYIACRAPEEFAAYAPYSGGFWRPHPEKCNGPVKMLHVHGWDDPVVPLEGRTFRRPTFTTRQGDIMEGLAMWRHVNGCQTEAPTRIARGPEYWTREWKCAPGSSLVFVLWPGGHESPMFWPKLAMDWFEQQTGAVVSVGR